MTKKIIFIPIFFVTISCSVFQDKALKTKYALHLKFCELSKYNNWLVNTKVIYSGNEKSWSARGFEDCSLNNQVYLNFGEWFKFRPITQFQLSFLKNHHSTHYGILQVTGQFEAKENFELDNGFGYQNRLPAQINVSSAYIKIKKKDSLPAASSTNQN